ncbi:histidine phosphatase family protein [Pseudovibrio ascidiaceicola]|uniref:histidine phosphatase family protein n=1 Tax=Pseudovibrio ascidiaceicola TaxID=285279 RepID=UPI003D35CFCD
MTIYLIRHAQSAFNAVFDPDKPDPMIFDAPITALGETQAKQARTKISQLDIQNIIVSPLTRALQTACLMFGDKIQFQINSLVRERLCHSCDVGTPPQELAKVFPHLDFDHLDDCWWHEGENAHRGISVEPQEVLQKRADEFAKYLKRERIHSTAIVTHGRFIRALTGCRINNCEMLKFETHQS